MKKETKQPRLKLLFRKETLRVVSEKELQQVVGASDICSGGPTADCTYRC